MAQQIDSNNPTVNQLADYIRFLDTELKTASSIKQYFKVLHNCLSNDSKFKLNFQSIRQLLTTVVHNKPTLPAVPGEIWDADRLVEHLLSLPPNRELTNIQISRKCIVLLMLASGQRKADIMALDISPKFMKKTKDAYYCSMSKPSKGNTSGHNNFMQFIEFHRFDSQPKLCLYRMLQDYIALVGNTVGEDSAKHSKLFVTTTSGSPAHRDTVTHWAADLLFDAGIGVHCVHSIRSASSSKSIQYKEPLENVMARCGWKRKSTFFKHYLRPVAMGLKPLADSDLTAFYCLDKLVDDRSKFILDSSFVLLQDVFVTTVPQRPPEIDKSLLPIDDSPFDPLPVSSASTTLPVSRALPGTSSAVIDLTSQPDFETLHHPPQPSFGQGVPSPPSKLPSKQTKPTV